MCYSNEAVFCGFLVEWKQLNVHEFSCIAVLFDVKQLFINIYVLQKFSCTSMLWNVSFTSLYTLVCYISRFHLIAVLAQLCQLFLWRNILLELALYFCRAPCCFCERRAAIYFRPQVSKTTYPFKLRNEDDNCR
jgi:hypothetical protein